MSTVIAASSGSVDGQLLALRLRSSFAVVDCWGENNAGQLGNDTTTSADTAVPVSGITDATGVTGGGTHACALLSTGHVKCWGSNLPGELGDGTTTNSDKPVDVMDI
jgi:alpha-tubulin suppressor-like RCC1 family protein